MSVGCRARLRPTASFIIRLVFFAVAWSALAFGAVYPWAYWPLLTICGLVGVLSLGLERPSQTRGLTPALPVALAGLVVAIQLQLVPLPGSILARVSPGTERFLRSYDLAYLFAPDRVDGAVATSSELFGRPWHALSVDPGQTVLGLCFLVFLALFFAGVVRIVSLAGALVMVRALLVLATVVAVVAVVQRGELATRIYGFWQPQFGGDPFGPFVNRNHFAGWMLMAVCLAAGNLCGLMASSRRGHRSAPRRPEPRPELIVLNLGAALLIGMSLVMTLSRSGVICFAVAMALMSVVVIRRLRRRVRRLFAVCCLSSVVAVGVVWAGIDSVSDRLLQAATRLDTPRLGIWFDTLRIIRDFPVAGTGLNTFGTVTLVYQTQTLDRHFIEAHNDYLQLVAEGGVLLGVPAAVVAGLLVREIRRRFREGGDGPRTYWVRVGAVTALVVVGLQELVDFSLQIPANAVFFAVVLAIAVHAPANRSRRAAMSVSSASACRHSQLVGGLKVHSPALTTFSFAHVLGYHDQCSSASRFARRLPSGRQPIPASSG